LFGISKQFIDKNISVVLTAQRMWTTEQRQRLTTWGIKKQNDQLMSERRVLGFKPAPRLEWRDQDGQYET